MLTYYEINALSKLVDIHEPWVREEDEKDKIQRAVIYARHSPRRGESESAEMQIADIRRWCADRMIEVRNYYVDRDVSGNTPAISRSGLAAALRDIRRGEYFIVRNINRVARNVAYALAIEQAVTSAGAQLVSLEDGGVQDDSPTLRLARIVKYAIAEYERVVNNNRTRTKMQHYIDADDRPMGSKAPIGWRIVDGKYVEDEDEQYALRVIKVCWMHGMSSKQIADTLTAMDIDPRKSEWHKRTVSRVIKRFIGGRKK